MSDDTRPTVLFLCVHNAGRSQMALGWFDHLAGDRAVAWSGGSEPGNEVNPAIYIPGKSTGVAGSCGALSGSFLPAAGAACDNQRCKHQCGDKT